MKKIFISLLLISIGVITGVLIRNTIYSNYITNGIITNTSSNSITKSSSIAMMLETSSGSGMYELSTNTSWPTSGYVFNTTLSKCENGSNISWNSTSNSVIVTGNNKDKCYIYFDILTETTLQAYSSGSEIWAYTYDTTRIVFDDSGSTINEYEEVFDISDANDGTILAYAVSNGNSTYTIYVESCTTILANEDMSYWFYNFESLESIEGLEKVNTSNVTDMEAMFDGCSNLTTLNLSSFDTRDVTDMSSMFAFCYNLTSLDLSSWDTSNVSSMSQMFDGCRSLTSLDLSNWDTSSVITMDSMFNFCGSLTSLDLSSFDTSKVKTMFCMFYNCSSLTSLDLSNADFSSVTDYETMFYYIFGITITVKDSTAKSFISSLINNWYSSGTVVIA